MRRSVQRRRHRRRRRPRSGSRAAGRGCASRLARCRSISSAGNAGSPRDVGHQVEQRREVPSQRARRRPAIASIVDAGAERARRAARLRRQSAARCASPCPSSSIAAVKLASPGLSAGFASLPVLTTRFAETIGRPGALVDEHRQTVRQLERRRRRQLQRPRRAGLRRLLAPRLVGIDRLGAGRRRAPVAGVGVGTGAPRSGCAGHAVHDDARASASAAAARTPCTDAGVTAR